MLDFADALGVQPEPEAAERQQHQAQRSEGGIGGFDRVAVGACEAVHDGAVVDLLDEVVPAFLGEEHLPGGEVYLDFGVIFYENNLDDSLVGPKVEAVNFISEAEAVTGEGEGEVLDAIHREPLAGVGAGAFLCGWGEARLFFPAEQHAGQADEEHENEKRNGHEFVQAAVSAGGAG